MARIAVSVIFFLFVSAQAYVPTESFIRSDSWILTESDSEPAASGTILLPSEKPEGKIITNFDWKADVNSEQLPESEVTVGKLPENEIKEASKPELESEIDGEKLPEIEVLQPEKEPVPTVEPLTVVTFRPINRHFHRMQEKRPFPLRMPHRCRHHFKPMGPRFIHRQIPFGNDMIMAREEEAPATTGPGPVFRGGRVPRHPARWMKLHHRGPKIPRGHTVLSREDFKSTHPRFEREDMERGPHDEKEQGGGLFKGFRKFLNRF